MSFGSEHLNIQTDPRVNPTGSPLGSAADAAPRIAAAVTVLLSLGGGDLYFPPGYYLIEATAVRRPTTAPIPGVTTGRLSGLGRLDKRYFGFRVLRFPEDITLMLAPGAVLVLGLAANIEIAGRIDAPLGQIFRRTGNTDLPPRDPPGGSSSSRVSVDLSGRVLFTGPGVKEVHPEWWGARSVGLAVQ